VTVRLRRLVDDVHEGNLLEASAHVGVPYATLREIHSGRTTNPGLQTLERIARAYLLPLDWFTAAESGSLPPAGWVGYLPPDAETGAGWRYARRVTIPFAATPLIRVLVRLERRLGALPPHPDRPILGGATDPRECRRRITAFVLGPLLAARQLGAKDVLLAEPALPGQSDLGGSDRQRWITMLKDLGLFWERALGGLVADPDGGDSTLPADEPPAG
jgi:transcriptional regulator with XRE-family HTH domain